MFSIKKNKSIYLLISIIIVLIFLLFIQFSVKKQIVVNTNNIIYKNNCRLAIEINGLVLDEEFSSNRNEVENLMEILYSTSFEGSGYKIKDRYYLDVYNNLNYFEEYVYKLKSIIKDNQIDDSEIIYLKKINEDMKKKLDEIQ